MLAEVAMSTPTANDFSLICGIQWVNAQGQATPDTNSAIALAQCQHLAPFKMSRQIPICQDHALRLDEPKMGRWRLLPLPGQAVEDYSPLVVRSLREWVEIPEPVVEAIRDWVREEDFPRVLRELGVRVRRAGTNDPKDNYGVEKIFALDHCFVLRHGMYVGIEPDGYIHKTTEEIRLLPLGKGAFLHVCRVHWQAEIDYRRMLKKAKRPEDLPDWSSLEVAFSKIQKDDQMTKDSKAVPARLDADRTAVPISRIVHHPPAGACVGPGSRLVQPEYEDDKGVRTPLKPARKPLSRAQELILKSVPAHGYSPGDRVRIKGTEAKGIVVLSVAGGLLRDEQVLVYLDEKHQGYLVQFDPGPPPDYKPIPRDRGSYVTIILVHPSNLLPE